MISRYQVQLKVLQAGQYGAPQSRNRIIFWGALRGYTLPPYPLPTHAYPVKVFFRKLAGGVKIPPVTRAPSPQNEDDYHQIAPHHPITVNDATSDLVSIVLFRFLL
jgi:DNA (cytosine-5)-methyltransferase 1